MVHIQITALVASLMEISKKKKIENASMKTTESNRTKAVNIT